MTNDVLLLSHLKRLRLPVVAQNYARLSKEAAAHNQSYEDYLAALLEGEVLQRDENAQKLRLARARFPVIKMLDSFDFGAIPSLNKALVLELYRGSFIDRNENVIAWVKNDHLGFVVYYTFQGVVHAYYPDFLLPMPKKESVKKPLVLLIIHD